MEKEKRKFKLKTPNSYVIIMAIIAIVAVLSWIIPGGAYDYVDPNADKLEPIAGTTVGCDHGSYHRIHGFR